MGIGEPSFLDDTEIGPWRTCAIPMRIFQTSTLLIVFAKISAIWCLVLTYLTSIISLEQISKSQVTSILSVLVSRRKKVDLALARIFATAPLSSAMANLVCTPIPPAACGRHNAGGVFWSEKSRNRLWNERGGNFVTEYRGDVLPN